MPKDHLIEDSYAAESSARFLATTVAFPASANSAKAADTIKAMRDEIKRLRAALADLHWTDGGSKTEATGEG